MITMNFYRYSIAYYSEYDEDIKTETGLTYGDCYADALDCVIKDFGFNDKEHCIAGLYLEQISTEGDLTISRSELKWAFAKNRPELTKEWVQ